MEKTNANDQGTVPNMPYTLQEERTVILKDLIQRWEDRAIDDPDILTGDQLEALKEDCEALLISDF